MSIATKSLQARKSVLASPEYQLALLNGATSPTLPTFADQLAKSGLSPLRRTGLDILQVNVGKLCNQTCKHCHVDAGPDRREVMTQTTMQHCLSALANGPFTTLDITGGAPEMTPHFRWFVEQAVALGKHVMVRCNLTIITANPKYRDLPEFFKANRVEVISSLPFYNSRKTDSQRGDGVFEKSIEALRMLNEVGYGQPGSGLLLHLVYNPTGAFLPPSQGSMEKEFKRALLQNHHIVFNQLYTITNMPISRFLEYLIESGNYEGYMEKLANSYNPVAAEQVMCRNMLSVGWDGYLYDCDFNQMLDMKLAHHQRAAHISELEAKWLMQEPIKTNQHCYGCAAGAGSSCGGTLS